MQLHPDVEQKATPHGVAFAYTVKDKGACIEAPFTLNRFLLSTHGSFSFTAGEFR